MTGLNYSNLGYTQDILKTRVITMTGQVGKWGNCLAVRLPKDITQELDLKANDTINFTVEEGKIVLEVIDAQPKFTLEELLTNYPETQEEEVDWGDAVGLEEC